MGERAKTRYSAGQLPENMRATAEIAEGCAQQTIPSSLEEKQGLLKDVQHRVKNTLQLITSLINLQASRVQEERTVVLLQAIRNRVYSIAEVYDFLCSSQERCTVDTIAYARRTIAQLVRAHDAGQRVDIRIEGEPIALDIDRAVSFGLVLTELVSNSCRHAFPAGCRGELRVEIARKDDFITLTVADNGIGLPPGLDYYRASSLGLTLIHMMVQQLDGKLNRLAGTGTGVRIQFPATASIEEEAL